jgi:hypothetical protein
MKLMKQMKNKKDCFPYFLFLSFIRFMSSCWNLLPSAGPTVIDRRYRISFPDTRAPAG